MDGVIGQIILWPGQKAPINWMICNGSLLSIQAYSSLLNVIGYQYGGSEAQKSFALPDLRGVFVRGVSPAAPIGVKTNPASTTLAGRAQGKFTLTTDNLPTHSHNATFSQNVTSVNDSIEISIPVDDSAVADSQAASQLILGRGSTLVGGAIRNYSTRQATNSLKPFRVSLPVIAGTVSNETTGNGKPVEFGMDFKGNVEVIPPSIAMNYIICVQGYYPQFE